LLHNFSPLAASVRVDLSTVLDGTGTIEGCQLWDMLGDDDHTVGDDGHAEIHLEGYGYRWLRIRHDRDDRLP